MSELRRLSNMLTGGRGRETANISPWGGVPHSRGDLPEQLYDLGKGRVQDIYQEHKAAPALQSISQLQGQPPELKKQMSDLTSQVVDTMTPVPISAVGTIVGPKAAKGWSDEAANKAKDLWAGDKYTSSTGVKSKTALAQDTGYYPDRAGNWKTQIDDVDAKLQSKLVNSIKFYEPKPKKGKFEASSLRDFWEHTELYQNYPEIASKTKVKFKPLENWALARVDTTMNYDGSMLGTIIEIDPRAVARYAKKEKLNMAEVYKDLFVHEGQHIVQAIEGHPGGSNPEYFEGIKNSFALKRLKATLKQMPESAPRAKQIREHLDFVEKIKKVPDGVLYRHTLGEADSGWAEKMRVRKDVKQYVPLHEKEVGRQYWGGKSQPFNPEWSAKTSREDELTAGIIP